jgi:4-hydroxyphenylacetate 3-monooxygenase
MIRTGDDYRQSIRDGREVWMNGERVEDVTTHPAFKPVVDIRARIYDLAHEDETRDVMTYADTETGERFAVGPKLPRAREDWHAKRRAVDTVLNDVGGVVTRVGDETVGEMWSLYDGQDVLNEVDPRFSKNIRRHVEHAVLADPFHVSANTDPKGDRSKRPQDQDPDMLLHVVCETDRGIVVRGAKYETAAAYANQAFVKPTIANWGDSELSDYALGFIVAMGAPGIKHICRTGFAGRAPAEDYPLSNRFDEIDTLVIFDDVEIPWEDVLFYRHTKAAAYIRATLHRYSAFPYTQRVLKLADMMIGAALFNARQTGLEKQQAVQEKLAQLACYREGINAHLTAAIAEAEASPGGLLMPNQSLLYTGRVLASSQLPAMMHIARELCGGQICVTPDVANFEHPETAPWMEKFYSINDDWVADDRRKLLAFARDLLNSDYASHRLTFQLFAQSPPYANLAAVYRSFDWEEPLAFVQKSAGLSDRVLPKKQTQKSPVTSGTH